MLYLAPEKKQRQMKPRTIDWPERFNSLSRQSQSYALKKYYNYGISAPEAPINQVPMVAVDFETTGMDPEQHGIVSIAAIPMTTERIFFSQAKSWVVKPRRTLTDQSVVIHGITHSDIEQAPDLESIIDELLELVAGKVWVVHYHGIERPFLQDAFKERLNESIQFPLIDTMEIEARFYRKPLSLWQKLRGKKPESIRLADSRDRYNLPFYPPHNATTDALACAELFQAQIAKHFEPTTPLDKIWLP
ncbi:3'-5' exonuclease [Idiomarina ramblicola]|uniref:DNA polymerase III subunit epsilon n=1 Tax=Idiomarina ramblicola TaxID=263724 RepID=A0A432Z5L3_9GAMM|nr:3'-5' exonuclease [Idiomarina ramblicola]RUO73109.1 DNA polymerase III subunit epsilon [Idiomarina ramblicola]